MDMNNKLWLRGICKKNNLHITEDQLLQLEEFVIRLSEWNRKINLISRTDIENIWSKHILGSISFLFTFSINSPSTIVDVGTGGGFPGIPLAILLSKSKLTLVDSIKKKIMVVEDMITQLNISNVQAVNGRAEEICMKEGFKKSYDYIIARAVAPTTDMIHWCAPFLRQEKHDADHPNTSSKNVQYIPPGHMILLKGGNLGQEIEQAKIKTKPKFIQDYPITVNGVDPADTSDKKVIVIQPL